MKKSLTLGILLLSTIFLSNNALALPIYADSLVDSQFVSSFFSGDVTGAPDGGGMWLGDTSDPPDNPGYITVGFSGGIIDGIGDDIFVVDVASSSSETANVFVSSDNVSFTLIGELNAVANSIDISGLFGATIHFVKIANSSNRVSMDVDAVGGNYAQEVDDTPPQNQVPEPSTLLFLGLGVVGLVGFRKKFK